MPKGNHHRDIVSEPEHENKNELATNKAQHDAESDRPKNKNSHKKKPFTCRVAIFDEKEDPNKKYMYPKSMVYQDGKDIQLEEIRAMHYWNKVKGTALDNLANRLNTHKTTQDQFTQTDPEPEKITQEIQTESVAVVKSKLTKKSQDIDPNLPRIATRSLTKAKLASKIPARSNLAQVIEEPATPSRGSGPSEINATFVVSKHKPIKEEKVNLHPSDLNGEHSDENDETDDTVNTKAFKVVAASTPFQEDKIKNKNQKDRRKAMKLEIPVPMW